MGLSLPSLTRLEKRLSVKHFNFIFESNITMQCPGMKSGH